MGPHSGPGGPGETIWSKHKTGLETLGLALSGQSQCLQVCLDSELGSYRSSRPFFFCLQARPGVWLFGVMEKYGLHIIGAVKICAVFLDNKV